MKGLNEFIVEIGKAFKNTITHGSLELYTDYRTKQHEQSNRRGKIVGLPMHKDTIVKEGAEVIIDPTVLFKQTYRGKTQKSQFLVNEEKGWYRVTPDMIILYKNPGEQWMGHRMNLFVTPLKNEVKKTDSGIFLPTPKNDTEGYATVAFGNKELEEVEGVVPGDIIFYPKDRKWEFEMEGEKYLYLRNIDVLAKRDPDGE